MTQAADIKRDQRQHWAAPGGSHDRLVRFLARWLPGLVGCVAAVMLLAPLTPRGEISFLLDRTKVAATPDRIKVTSAMYRGKDAKGRPFTVTAGNAVQSKASEPIVRMDDLVARILMADGPAELSAGHGDYHFDSDQMVVTGPVQFSAADGYHLTANGVTIDLKTRRAVGAGGISGAIPAGTFSADRIVADLGERAVTLDGHARLRMTPGQLRMP